MTSGIHSANGGAGRFVTSPFMKITVVEDDPMEVGKKGVRRDKIKTLGKLIFFLLLLWLLWMETGN